MVAASTAGADVDIPEELKKVVPIYPEIIRVFEKMDLENGIGVIMAVNGSPLEVVDFYKKGMTEKKWEIVAERKDETGGTAGLLMKKEDERIQVSARKRPSGGSTVILTLRKAEPVEKKTPEGNS